MNEDALVQVFSSGYYYPALWRELPAAVLAAESGDTAPILRLGAETVTVDAGGEDPPSSSEALYLAVTCHDYPQLWDPDTPIEDRPEEVEERLADYPDGAFTPFTGAAWTGTDYEGWLSCLRWPSPVRDDPPDPPGADYPDVPTLVLNGDLDTITSSAQAAEVARRFPESTFVEVLNSFHVTALYDKDACASRIYVRFLLTLDTGDTGCARRIAEPHLVPLFATRLQDVAPADPVQGDDSRRSDRQLAAAAAATVADVLSRWWVNYDGTSVGLRGGTWSYEGDDPVVFDLDRGRVRARREGHGEGTLARRGQELHGRCRGRGRRSRRRGSSGSAGRSASSGPRPRSEARSRADGSPQRCPRPDAAHRTGRHHSLEPAACGQHPVRREPGCPLRQRLRRPPSA